MSPSSPSLKNVVALDHEEGWFDIILLPLQISPGEGRIS